MKKAVLLFLLMLGAALAAAPQLYFTADTCKEPLSYKCGEEITFSLRLTDGKSFPENVPFRWELFVEGGKTLKGKAVTSADKPFVIKTKIDKPGFAYVFACAVDQKGKARKDVLQLSASAGAEVEKITQSVPEPADFDAYWAGQLERLKQVPMETKLTPVTSKYKNVDCFYFEIAAPGANPATGYLSMPKNAKPGSLKAYVFFYGYGFGAIKKQDQVASRGNLVLSVSRYGIPQGRDKAFYQKAGKTTLKKFGFRNNASAAECDFNYMILRDLRAVEYLKSRPEWNGRDLIARGGSQGGMQTVWAAALDSDVTEAYPYITWCCDLAGASKAQRLAAYWRIQYVPALDYYDPVFMAKRIKNAKVVITRAGLGDYICPPSGLAILYNNLATLDKTIVWVQGSDHGFVPKKSEVITWRSGK